MYDSKPQRFIPPTDYGVSGLYPPGEVGMSGYGYRVMRPTDVGLAGFVAPGRVGAGELSGLGQDLFGGTDEAKLMELPAAVRTAPAAPVARPAAPAAPAVSVTEKIGTGIDWISKLAQVGGDIYAKTQAAKKKKGGVAGALQSVFGGGAAQPGALAAKPGVPTWVYIAGGAAVAVVLAVVLMRRPAPSK